MRTGAWISRRLGCERKICLALTQSWRISPSDSCTCFPPFPSNSLLIISSNTPLSIIPSIVIIIISCFNKARDEKSSYQVELFLESGWGMKKLINFQRKQTEGGRRRNGYLIKWNKSTKKPNFIDTGRRKRKRVYKENPRFYW